jgi:hypothetical protein
MTLLHRLASILRWMVRRDRAERDLNDELEALSRHDRRRKDAGRLSTSRSTAPGFVLGYNAVGGVTIPDGRVPVSAAAANDLAPFPQVQVVNPHVL